MSFVSLVWLALGLAMDSTAVAAARGVALPKVQARHALLVAIFFGGVQAALLGLGWFLSTGLQNQLGPGGMSSASGGDPASWARLLVRWGPPVLLLGIGAKMLWEARPGSTAHAGADDLAGPPEANGLEPWVVFGLALATSIDALGVGLTLPLLAAPLTLSLLTTAVVTATVSTLGLYAGRHLGSMLGPRLEAFGGLILVLLALRIVVDALNSP